MPQKHVTKVQNRITNKKSLGVSKAPIKPSKFIVAENSQKVNLVVQKIRENFKMENVKEAQTHAQHAFSGFQLTHDLLNNLQQFKVSPTAKLVLLYLASCYNSTKKFVFPKQKTIALKLGISERSVVRAVSELVKAGVILVECKYSNKYAFVSRNVAECSQNEKKFTAEKLSDDLGQNDAKECDNLSLHDIEPVREHEKQPAEVFEVENYKILRDYAIKHGAKNVQAYINALKKSGNCREILDSYKAVKKSSECMLRRAQQVIENNRIARETREEPTQAWKDLKKILIERCGKIKPDAERNASGVNQ